MAPQALLALCCLIVATSGAAQECGPHSEILSQNFDEHDGSKYVPWTYQDMQRAWPKSLAREDFRGNYQTPGLVYSKGIERASVGGGHLRLAHPKGCVGTRECGMVFTVRLEEEFDEGTLSYQFRFSEEYGKNGGQWTLGGKLPGLADEDAASGCKSDDVTGTGSFVARAMWRFGGQLVSYMYITPTKDECVNGEDWFYDKKAEADVWYTMYMYIKLNTPGEEDGVHKIWIRDGGETELVFSRTDVLYRSIDGHGIAKLKFQKPQASIFRLFENSFKRSLYRVFHMGSRLESPTTCLEPHHSSEDWKVPYSNFSTAFVTSFSFDLFQHPTWTWSGNAYIYFDNLKINKGLCVDGLDPPPPPPPSPPPSPPQEPLITDPVGTTAAVAIPPIVTSPPPKAGLGLHTQSGIATPCNASLAAGAVGTSELSNHGCLTGSSAGNSSTPSENTTTAVSPAEAPISANNVRGEAANNTSNGVEEISFSPLKEVMFVTGSISIVTTLLISFN